MVELVHKPSVIPVGMTVIDPDAIGQWAAEHGYEDAYLDDTTPLGKIRVAVESNYPETDLDTLPEFAGRFCYRSFRKGRDSAEYIGNILESRHGSVLEHSMVSFAVSGVSRTLTHELVRHRAGTGISQESQRYVDAKDIRFVVPPLVELLPEEWKETALKEMEEDCGYALEKYQRYQTMFNMANLSKDMKTKRINEAARCILPNMTETRLIWTMNLRAARHVCSLRGTMHADLEIRRLALAFTGLMQHLAPLTFQDFSIDEATDGLFSVEAKHGAV